MLKHPSTLLAHKAARSLATTKWIVVYRRTTPFSGDLPFCGPLDGGG